MARSTPEEIRRRIAKRKGTSGGKSPSNNNLLPGDEEKYGYDPTPIFDSEQADEGHPLFKKEVFLFKILASVCLFLCIAILFRNHTGTLDPARTWVLKSMDTDFKFATVSKWYEDKFGKPLTLLPFTEKSKTGTSTVAQTQKGLAIPASGKILENFKKNGQGIMIETGKGASVEAMNGGIVQFAGVKDGLGKTVIIQHADQTESWYGNLDQIKVNLYEYVDKSKVVGTVSTSTGEDKTKGKYYFAIKKGDAFIDPNQVIRFD